MKERKRAAFLSGSSRSEVNVYWDEHEARRQEEERWRSKFKMRHPEADPLTIETMVGLVMGNPRITARREPDDNGKKQG